MAIKTLGFLRRNLTLETKIAEYKALVRPQIEYAALIWNPHHQVDYMAGIVRQVAFRSSGLKVE